MFNHILYKQIGGVDMVFSLDPSLANVFLDYHKENWFDRYPLKYRALY